MLEFIHDGFPQTAVYRFSGNRFSCGADSRIIRHGGEIMSAAKLIYHMCRREEWDAACVAGSYAGSTQDVADGFIHFSTAQQLPESARRHRAGQAGLVLLAVDPELLRDGLQWEASRRGELFPHLYGVLPVSAVRWARDLPLGADGQHVLPALE
jgi:uncharacterized protein (DUF952 family)